MKMELIELLEQYNIDNKELSTLLSFVDEDADMTIRDNRLLALDEILNYKKNIETRYNIIPLMECKTGLYLIYNIDDLKFQMLDTKNDSIVETLEHIREYINILSVSDIDEE